MDLSHSHIDPVGWGIPIIALFFSFSFFFRKDIST